MNTIHRYLPAFFEGFDDLSVDFNTIEELVEIDFVKRFSTDKSFVRFIINNESRRPTLMAECNNGENKYLVGFFEHEVAPPDSGDHENVKIGG